MKHVPLTEDNQMPKAFDPQAVEAGWYARWESDGLFIADANSENRKFTICLPPPNITGELHMGHALNHTLQDIVARYRRMAGYEVLFLPGTDHAAIATQNVIEKQLAAEGMTKEQLGREASTARVDEWYRTGGAVRPIDECYRSLIGTAGLLPLVGSKLPIVGDDAVDKAFRAGALKGPPGHAPMDWAIGPRPGLWICNWMRHAAFMHRPDLP